MSQLNSILSILLDSYGNQIEQIDVVTQLPQRVNGTSIPAAGAYAKGCIFTKTDTAGGSASVYENTGTTSVPVFTLIGVSSPGTVNLAHNHVLVGGVTNLATDVAMSGDTTIADTGAVTIANNAVTTVKILAANVTLAKLAAGITPSHVVKFAGTSAPYAGGGTSTAITVTGAQATDVATAVIRASTNSVSINKAVLTADTLTITFSADPGAATTIDYSVLRAAS